MSDIFIRPFGANDWFSTHELYDSLSYEDKRCFHPGFLGFRNRNLSWLLAQLLLLISSLALLRRILQGCSCLCGMVAVNDCGELVGFGHLWVKGMNARLGMFVKDEYRGRGVASDLLRKLIDLARAMRIRKIALAVLADNIRALGLYERHGFKKVGTTVDIWRIRKYHSIEMCLCLR